MERYEIKAITEGKFKGRSLVFHILDYTLRKNYEFVLNSTNLKSFNLRLIYIKLSKHKIQYIFTVIIIFILDASTFKKLTHMVIVKRSLHWL